MGCPPGSYGVWYTFAYEWVAPGKKWVAPGKNYLLDMVLRYRCLGSSATPPLLSLCGKSSTWRNKAESEPFRTTMVPLCLLWLARLWHRSRRRLDLLVCHCSSAIVSFGGVRLKWNKYAIVRKCYPNECENHKTILEKGVYKNKNITLLTKCNTVFRECRSYWQNLNWW